MSEGLRSREARSRGAAEARGGALEVTLAPASYAQRRLWFLDRLEPGNVAYHVPGAVRFTGELEPAVMERALAEIVRRHDALRTTFASQDGETVQLVHPRMAVPLLHRHLADPGELAAEIHRECHRPFDLVRGPLLRAALFRLGPREHVLLIVFHHVVSDGWSVGVFVGELSALYERLARGRDPDLPELPIQYPDYARWQREWLAGGVLERQLAYWKEQLAGGLPTLALPADFPRPAVQSHRGATAVFDLPASAVEPLAALCRRTGASLFMVLLAAFKALLHRLTREEDLVVGSPIANRERLELEPLIGFFVNTLVLRTRVTGELPFVQLLERVKATCLEAYAHQDVPFELLVEALAPERDRSRPPLFQLLFVLQNAPRELPRPAGLGVEPLEVATDGAKFDLTVMLEEGPDGLRGRWEYNTDLFTAATVARLAGWYRRVLAAVAADPERPVGALPLLTSAERRELVERWRPRPVTPAGPATLDTPATLGEAFARRARLHPHRVAVTAGGDGASEALTYGELERRSRHLARRLADWGVGPEVLVGLGAERSPELVVALLGILRSGGAYLPLDPGYPDQRLALMIEDSGVRTLVTPPRLTPRYAGLAPGLDVLPLEAEPPLSGIGAVRLPPVLNTESKTALEIQGGGNRGGEPGSGAQERSEVSDQACDGERGGKVPRVSERPQGASSRGTRSAAGSRPVGSDPATAEDPVSPERSGGPTPDLVSAGPGNAAYVIYTSGSTGRPKGVVVTHHDVLRLMAATEAWFGFDESDVWTLFHSYAFDFSVWELWGALLYGGRLVVVPFAASRSPRDIHRLLADERVTVLNQTPSAFRALSAWDEEAARSPASDALAALRWVIFGGEALELASLAGWLARRGEERPRLVNMYGITETTVHVTWRPLSHRDVEERRGSVIGRPIPDLGLYLLDPGLEPVPAGVSGEIWVGGAGLARGYLGRPVLTAERFVPDPFADGAQAAGGGRLYRTGDLGRLTAAGEVEYLGRADHQVKVRGFRIEPGEIEAALTAQPGVAQAVVIPREGAGGSRRLVAYAVAGGEDAGAGGPPPVEELRRALARRLPDYMLPAAILWLDRLPLTAHGKLDRRALLALAIPELDQAVSHRRYQAPGSEAEEVLAQIWAQVLGLERVGVRDDFFELGGDSILSLVIVSRAARRGLKLTPAQLFDHPTVAELAAVAAPVQEPPAPGEEPSPVAGRESLPPALRDRPGLLAALPLSPLQEGMLFEALLDRRAGAYFEQVTAVMEGELEPAAFTGAWDEVVARHEILRTSFHHLEGAEPLQVVWERVAVPFAVLDASRLAPEEEERLFARLLAQDRERGFQLDRPPLLRMTLVLCQSPSDPFGPPARGAEPGYGAVSRHLPGKRFLGARRREPSAPAVHTPSLPARPSPVDRSPVRRRDGTGGAEGRAPGRWRWLWSYHHLLLDGWSLPLLFREALTLYRARLDGRPAELPPARPFRDYLRWLQEQDPAAARPHWRRLLAGFTGSGPLRLPAPLPGTGGEAEDVDLALAQEETAVLTTWAQERRLTLGTLTQGAWALLLGRYGCGPDLCFGLTVSGRPAELPGVEEMVGLFINTLPVRVRVEERAETLPFLAALQEQVTASRRYEHSRLVEIQAASDVEAGRPLFETLLVFENYLGGESLEGLAESFRLRRVQVLERTNYPLTAAVLPGRRLALRASFDPGRFEAAAMERLLRHWRRLLVGITAGARRLGELELLEPAERRQLLAWSEAPQAGATATAGPQPSAPEQVAEQVRQRPETLAVVAGDEALSYRALLDRAGRLATLLRHRGLAPEGIVALCLPPTAATAWALLGVQQAGGAYLPLDPRLPARRRRELLADSGATFLLTTTEVDWDDHPPAGNQPLDHRPPDLPPRSAQQGEEAGLSGGVARADGGLSTVDCRLSTGREGGSDPATCGRPGPAGADGGRPLDQAPGAPAMRYWAGESGGGAGSGAQERSEASDEACDGEWREEGPRLSERAQRASSRAARSEAGSTPVGSDPATAEEPAPPELLGGQPLAEGWDVPLQMLQLDRIQSELAACEPLPPGPLPPERLAYVIYTSGSTGRTKGVMVPHRGLANLARAQSRAFGLEPGQRLLQLASPSFDAAVSEIFIALTSGATLCFDPEGSARTPGGLARAVARLAIDNATLPPALLPALDPAEFPRPGTLVLAGEAASQEAYARWAAPPRRRLFNAYGPTEGTVCATLEEVAPGEPGVPPGWEVTLGRPMAGVRVLLLDAALRPVPAGVPGEIFLGGEGLARGYLGRPAWTAARFLPDGVGGAAGERLYATGDLGRRRPDGRLQFLGRADFQVKVRGFRIELGEVEAALAGHPGLDGAVVVAAEGPGGGKRLVAYTVAATAESPSAGELRCHLEERLPDYMVPALFVPLGSWPLTATGKVDRRVLPAPEESAPAAGEGHVAPRSPVEATLATIWREVLGVERVGLRDRFVALGGDSILALQVIARAHRAGLAITPRQLFSEPDLERLAAVAGRREPEAGAGDEAPLEGAVPLTPIQRWFFDQEQPEPHHFNQSLFLELPAGADAEALARALAAVLARHDALRLRFRRDEDGSWLQEYGDGAGAPTLERLDLADRDPEARHQAMAETAERLQRGFDLAAGPLLAAAWFDLGPAVGGRLFIAVHHLVVDGVSWRILLEDLFTAYQQLARGEEPALPPLTSSFRRWAELLTRRAASPEVARQLPYWQRQVPSAPLPVDPAAGVEPAGAELNRVAEAASVEGSLTPQETEELLRRAPAAYNSQINDLLLAALLLAYRRWSGERALVVDLESHGRQELETGLDLTRTVGWFTCLFPLRLELPPDESPGEVIKAVKEQLRAVPEGGLGWGLLAYLHPDPMVRREMAALPRPEVSFNYFGQLDPGVQTQGVRLADGPTGAEQSPRARRTHRLDLSGRVVGGRLTLQWIYCGKLHRRSTVEALAGEYLSALRELVAHCLAPEAGGYTPSDFQQVDLDRRELDALFEDLEI